MANQYWIGKAATVAQVNTITPTAANNATYTITRNGKSVTYLADASALVAEITAGLVAAAQASTEPEFKEITWADTGTTVTATYNGNDGKPFTQTSSATAGALVTATTRAAVSPHDINNATNWGNGSGGAGAVPVTGDSIFFQDSDVDALWNLDALQAQDIVAFTRKWTFTGKIGLPTFEEDNYWEDRPTELLMRTCTTVTIEQPATDGPEQIKLSTGTNASTWIVYGQGSGTLGQELMWIRGANVANTLLCDGGSVAVARNLGQVATLGGASALKLVNGGVVYCGAGVTFNGATVAATNSTAYIQSAVATLILDGSTTATLVGTGFTVGTLTFNSGALVVIGTWTFTNFTMFGLAAIDFSQDRSAKTITNKAIFYEGCVFNDPDTTVTLSAGWQVKGGRPSNCTLDFGPDRTYTVA